MSSIKTQTVKAKIAGSNPMGNRNDARLSAAFPNSPLAIGKNTYSEEYLLNLSEAVLKGNGGPGDEMPGANTKNGVINDQGYAFGSFDLNYTSAPDFNNVQVGGEGKPASAFVPNIASAEGAIPSNQPEFLGDLPEKSSLYGSGAGGTLSPSETSRLISAQKLGDLSLGPVAGQSKSYS
tara:strand:- start:281 stop:817 length:537 start_codon:yes stop_codon:yes gene_type:complete